MALPINLNDLLEAMKRNGSPRPEFQFDEDHSYFMTRLPVHPQARGTGSGERTEQVTPQVAPQVTPQVTPQVEQLVSVCDRPLSREELQDRLGLQDRENFRKLYLLPALEAGLVERTIPDKPNSRLQKYCLTKKGTDLLASKRKPEGAN